MTASFDNKLKHPKNGSSKQKTAEEITNYCKQNYNLRFLNLKRGMLETRGRVNLEIGTRLKKYGDQDQNTNT